jgi:hypothetical protein
VIQSEMLFEEKVRADTESGRRGEGRQGPTRKNGLNLETGACPSPVVD